VEALYSLGEKTQALVDLMNLDVMSHGRSLYAELIVRRLREYGIAIAFVERNRRFLYDLAAFKEYLKRSPGGTRAADAGFRLIAESFYRSIGTDAAQMVDLDVDGLRGAILQKEAFLKEHPQSEKIREVRFLLAMDYYRLYKNSPDAATARRYEKLSAQALQEIVKDYPGTAEARAAQVTLETFRRPGQRNYNSRASFAPPSCQPFTPARPRSPRQTRLSSSAQNRASLKSSPPRRSGNPPRACT
jgi:TolA-binding protein